MPKARGVIRIPGAAWRRLYSERSTSRITSSTVSAGIPAAIISSRPWSRSTALAVYGDGMVAMGQSINVSFMRPISEGTIDVRARARHRGRTTWVWDAEVLNDQGQICALAQMTIAVRPLPKS